MLRLQPSKLSGIKEIKYVFNLTNVGYVFPKRILFILKFVEITKLVIKNPNFDLTEAIKMEQLKNVKIVLGKT